MDIVDLVLRAILVLVLLFSLYYVRDLKAKKRALENELREVRKGISYKRAKCECHNTPHKCDLEVDVLPEHYTRANTSGWYFILARECPNRQQYNSRDYSKYAEMSDYVVMETNAPC